MVAKNLLCLVPNHAGVINIHDQVAFVNVVSSMLVSGFILGKDAMLKAKAFDEKHHFISTATTKVALLKQKIGFTKKSSIGTTMVNDKVRKRPNVSSS